MILPSKQSPKFDVKANSSSFILHSSHFKLHASFLTLHSRLEDVILVLSGVEVFAALRFSFFTFHFSFFIYIPPPAPAHHRY